MSPTGHGECGRLVAQVIGSSAEAADARLIAAAPELLAALTKTRKELRACQAVIHLAGGFDQAYVQDAQAAMKIADAAIAKATSATQQQAEPVAEPKCDTCHGTGQYCVGTSGLESDGNALVMERCPECGYGDEQQAGPVAETMTLQEVWEAAGGNPGIKPTREDVIEALRQLDEVCDSADADARDAAKSSQRESVVDRVAEMRNLALDVAVAAVGEMSRASRSVFELDKLHAIIDRVMAERGAA
ncbi:hypothetical protein UAM5_00065 [Ralstonia phage UAM5]|nr:hypothetical protein UAM5_00065 [Ralstonia phage UAM5]